MSMHRRLPSMENTHPYRVQEIPNQHMEIEPYNTLYADPCSLQTGRFSPVRCPVATLEQTLEYPCHVLLQLQQ